MAHAQKTDFVFRRNGRVHLNRQGLQFSRLLAAEVCSSEVVMLDAPCSQIVWRVLATQSILQFPLHFPSRASLCAITFQLDLPVFQTLKTVNRYRKSSLESSRGCNACSPARNPAGRLSYHRHISTEIRAHRLDNGTAWSLFSSSLKVRCEYLNLKLFHSHFLNNVRIS